MSDLLFVYGTLMSSEETEAARRLGTEAELLGKALTAGRLYDQGKWPGLIQTNDEDQIVHGELWRLRSLSSLKWLDIYEGIRPEVQSPEYARDLIRVKDNGSCGRIAWGYVYRWPIHEPDLIASGRWQDRRLRVRAAHSHGLDAATASA